MKKKSTKVFKAELYFIDLILKETGRKCEVCGRKEGPGIYVFVHFIDRNNKNRVRENTLVGCGPCLQVFIRSNPEGLVTTGGLWAFAINRGLYPKAKKDPPPKKDQRRADRKDKSSSLPSTSKVRPKRSVKRRHLPSHT